MTIKIKRYLLPVILLLIIAACSVKQPLHKVSAPEITSDDSTKDSTEYELIVFDTGFETWYLMKNSPALSRSIEYYKSWNRQYVMEWNYKSGSSRYSSFFGEPINYDPQEDYPFEIEHKLFYYFQYVEKELKIPILEGGPRPMP